MRIVTNQDIQALGITPKQCVDWVREAFLIKGECQLPPKISLHPQGSDFINTMPCLLPEKYHTYGCKIVSRIQGSDPALRSDMMVVDSKTGEFKALMQADWITAMRTGAVAALAIHTFEKSDAKIYSFMGLGAMGHAVLDCLLGVYDMKGKTIRFKRYKDHADKAVLHYQVQYPEVNFEIADTMEDFVDDADVIVSCITVAEHMLVDDINLFKPGVLIVPVHTRGFQNCDTVFEKVFGDDEGHVSNFQYFKQFRSFGEIGEVLRKENPGRENDEERILSYNIGLGLHDIFYAHKILEML